MPRDTFDRVRDPKSPADMLVGEPVALGLFQDWTLLAKTIILGDSEGIMLVVRPHRYHPFVTERFGFRADDNEFVVWSGTYHETLDKAIEEYNDRIGERDPKGSVSEMLHRHALGLNQRTETDSDHEARLVAEGDEITARYYDEH